MSDGSDRIKTPCVTLMRKVLIATYPWAFFTPGGGEIQLMKIYEHVKSSNIDISLFDQWNPPSGEVLYHFFSAMGGSLDFLRYIKSKGNQIAQSSSLWLTDENIDNYPVSYISEQFSFSDIIVANSKAEKNMLIHFSITREEKIRVVYNGFDKRLLYLRDRCLPRSEILEKHGLHEGDYVVFVGNIERRKNLDILIEACRSLEIPLIVIGGDRDPLYREKCGIGHKGILDDGLLYLGYLVNSSDDFISLVKHSRALVLPSALETPGLAALEAAALGVPILVTQNGSAYEYFGDTCRYYDGASRSFDDLRNALSDIWKHPSAYIVPTNTIASYSWESVSVSQVNVYKELSLCES